MGLFLYISVICVSAMVGAILTIIGLRLQERYLAASKKNPLPSLFVVLLFTLNYLFGLIFIINRFSTPGVPASDESMLKLFCVCFAWTSPLIVVLIRWVILQRRKPGGPLWEIYDRKGNKRQKDPVEDGSPL
jgi:hypothetical protein